VIGFIVELTQGTNYAYSTPTPTPSASPGSNVDVVLTDLSNPKAPSSTEYVYTCVAGQAVGGKVTPERHG
jgi:hypothetical protein